jgi:hypothetical protein
MRLGAFESGKIGGGMIKLRRARRGGGGPCRTATATTSEGAASALRSTTADDELVDVDPGDDMVVRL